MGRPAKKQKSKNTKNTLTKISEEARVSKPVFDPRSRVAAGLGRNTQPKQGAFRTRPERGGSPPGEALGAEQPEETGDKGTKGPSSCRYPSRVPCPYEKKVERRASPQQREVNPVFLGAITHFSGNILRALRTLPHCA